MRDAAPAADDSLVRPLLCPRFHRVGRNALMTIVCLSVRLSVCPIPDPKSRMKERRKLKIGWKETRDMRDP